MSLGSFTSTARRGVARHVRLVAETAGRLADRAGVRASDNAVVAEQYACFTNTAVLDAIRRHTTLCGNPTALDKLLFIADKLSWSPSDAPYHQGLVVAVEESIDHAVAFFLAWSWQQRYPVVHPWLREAYEAFC